MAKIFSASMRLDMPAKDDYTPTTVVVVLKVEGESPRTVDIVVDGVSDARNISPDSIKPTPDYRVSKGFSAFR